MKKALYFLTVLFFSTATLFAQIVAVDDFEGGDLGHFEGSSPGLSGSTAGITDVAPALDSVNYFEGNASMSFQLLDDAGSTADWFVRFISGPPSASLATNLQLGATGYIGYALMGTGGSGNLTCGIGMDAPGTAERSDSQTVILDGNWYLYQWNLEDADSWNAWVVGNGIIEDPVSIDAIWFYAPDGTPDAQLNMDFVSWNATGEVPVELISFNYSVSQNNVNLRWVTATETNNAGFDIERSYAGNDFQKVGYMEGHGTAAHINSYNFTDVVSDAGKYYYRLKQVDYDGTYEYSNTIEVDVIALPGEYALAQNYPNPFNPTTSITYQIPEAGHVRLSVYNMLGQKVADLVNEIKASGSHTIQFSAENLASGTYVYRLETADFSDTKKMNFIK